MRTVSAAWRFEAGMSVMELLVVIALMGIIGGYTTTAVVQGMRQSEQAQRHIDTLVELQKAAERVTRELRAACPIEGPVDPYATAVAVQRDGSWWRYDFRQPLGTEELRLDRDVWSTSGSWVDDHDTVVIDGVGNRGASQPLFTYLQGDGSTATTPQDVDRIEVTLRRDGLGASPVVVETSVEIRNGGRPCPAR